MKFHFNSDNMAGASDQILQALLACNEGFVDPYGADDLSQNLNRIYSDLFERDCHVFPVPTGTAGNALALAAITPPYGTIFCHERAHIQMSECGAAEFFTGGGRLSSIAGGDSKISVETLHDAIHRHRVGVVHHMEASAVSITQATEKGAVYSLGEVAAISEVATKYGLKLHMDGARFANAMVALNASPAEMTWKSGVDILTFGTTKNGTLNAEAVIAFEPEAAYKLRFLHKRAGYLKSKMRFDTAQLLAYINNDLWVSNARAANAAARRIADAIETAEGAELAYPVVTNQLFVRLSPALQNKLHAEGITLRPWPTSDGTEMFRMVFSYREDPSALDRLADALTASASKRAAIEN